MTAAARETVRIHDRLLGRLIAMPIPYRTAGLRRNVYSLADVVEDRAEPQTLAHRPGTVPLRKALAERYARGHD